MSYYELFLLAIGLCLDTFAVSVSGGICLGPHCRRRRRIIILTMSLFQSSMAILGWLAGSGFQHLIENCDHWIAFGLLLFIGGKMLVESFTKTEGEKINLLNNKTLITVSFATSIDALAVGVSLALLHLP